MIEVLLTVYTVSVLVCILMMFYVYKNNYKIPSEEIFAVFLLVFTPIVNTAIILTCLVTWDERNK